MDNKKPEITATGDEVSAKDYASGSEWTQHKEYDCSEGGWRWIIDLPVSGLTEEQQIEIADVLRADNIETKADCARILGGIDVLRVSDPASVAAALTHEPPFNITIKESLRQPGQIKRIRPQLS